MTGTTQNVMHTSENYKHCCDIKSDLAPRRKLEPFIKLYKTMQQTMQLLLAILCMTPNNGYPYISIEKQNNATTHTEGHYSRETIEAKCPNLPKQLYTPKVLALCLPTRVQHQNAST